MAVALAAVACDGGRPSKSRDEIAADSALAQDLALANRDTLLVDSIGEYRPPDAAERDTAVAKDSVTVSSPAQPVASAPVAPPAAAPAPPPAPAVASGPTRKGTAACSSPLKADQEECLRAILPAADLRMNRIYRALVTEMRRQEGVGSGPDPASIERLRVSQRAWLVYRDNQCRRRGRGREGALWARPRVRCLGEFSVRRANELADQFSRLTAH